MATPAHNNKRGTKSKAKSSASTQALLRQQLLGLSAPHARAKPQNSWSKPNKSKPAKDARRNRAVVSKDGVPLTKAELLRRDEARERARTAQRNAAYLSAGSAARAAEREAVTRLLATQRRVRARAKPNQRNAVKVGERKLGPGFLERYGTAASTAGQ